MNKNISYAWYLSCAETAQTSLKMNSHPPTSFPGKTLRKFIINSKPFVILRKNVVNFTSSSYHTCCHSYVSYHLAIR